MSIQAKSNVATILKYGVKATENENFTGVYTKLAENMHD